jgi:hypothetical protein
MNVTVGMHESKPALDRVLSACGVCCVDPPPWEAYLAEAALADSPEDCVLVHLVARGVDVEGG